MKGMSAREITLLRRLVRGLEFRYLPDLVGQRFSVPHVDALLASANLLELAGLEGALENDTLDLERTMLGYGFVDLRYRLSRWPAELQTTGSKVAADLLRDDAFDRATESEPDRFERLDHLALLCDEVDEGVRQLRVMADARGLRDLTSRERLRFRMTAGRAAAEGRLFPEDFEVRDAYITNAPTVGLFRNFYL